MGVKVQLKKFKSIIIHFASTDKEWSKLVLAKTNSTCVLCGKPATPAHIISRRFKKTRLAVENGQPLCVVHHNFFDSLSVKDHEKMSILLVGLNVYKKLVDLSTSYSEVKSWSN